ncbi:MAG: (d)CMP kinase [Pseudomonadota bacterium]|nr:(d)CMP kinase [Pseudomonadota bacterium]
MSVPVITIDGPASSGKGTVASRVASLLGYHYLDSGALYRLVAFLALRKGMSSEAAGDLGELARTLTVRFELDRIFLEQEDVTLAIRDESVGKMASMISAIPQVRAGLLEKQRNFRKLPGLVCDGRDMGTVVFSDALLKVYLTARQEIRAQRRYKQLMEKEKGGSIENILADIRERDARDTMRAVAPLRQSQDAFFLDTSQLTIDEAVQEVLRRYEVVKPW